MRDEKMNLNTFKLIHSELIQQVQGIEYDLKLIYAAIKSGELDENFAAVQHFSLGEIAVELKKLDYSDHVPDLSEDEYALIDRIRLIRNYWCHQCYIDFMYIQNPDMRESKFNKIAEKLQQDESQTYELFCKLEDFRLKELKRYGRI